MSASRARPSKTFFYAIAAVLALLGLGLLLGAVGGGGELDRLIVRLAGEAGGHKIILAVTDLSGFFLWHVGEGGALLLLLALAAGLGVFLFGLRRSDQLGAVAGVAFKEVYRGGALWVALIAAALLAFGAPFLNVVGGPGDRVKMILSVTLAAAAAVGTLLAVALPALGFTREMETRSIYVTVTKPAPRWVVFSGRFLGICLALAAALAILGVGSAVAVRLALAGEVRKARAARVASADSEALPDPGHVWLAARFRRDPRPPLAPLEEGQVRKTETVSRGKQKTLLLDVPPSVREDKWLVVRLFTRPGSPHVQRVPALVTFGEGGARRINVNRDSPVDVVAPTSAVRDGKLKVKLEPEAGPGGYWVELRLDPRGAAAVTAPGDGLELTLLKSLALVWLQLVFIAAVTLTAAGALSFPVAAVTGAAAALAGQLSGLAVTVLRKSVAAGHDAGAQSHDHVCHIHHAPASAGGEAEKVEILGQPIRQGAAGLLSILPDFGAFSPGEFLAAGDLVPWRFVAAGAVGLAVLRVLPAALIGCLVFSRREVGK